MKRKNPKRDYNMVFDSGLNKAQALAEGIRRHGPSDPDPDPETIDLKLIYKMRDSILVMERNTRLRDFMAGWMRDRQIRRFRSGGTAHGNGHGKRSRMLQVIPARPVKK